MRRNLFLSLAVVMLSCSCGTHGISKELRAFMNEKVVIPEHVLCITAYNTDLYKDTTNAAKFIISLDSMQCASCAITRLGDYEPFIEEMDSIGKCEVMVIFSPGEDEYVDILMQLESLKFRHPLYIDPFREFYALNKIPSDGRFHCFLIDDYGKPLFVGDPTSNDDLSQVFHQVLETI